MAARKTAALNENWRTRIQTSMLINRLQGHVKGSVDMSKSQVSAALGLLKKTVPDLAALAIVTQPDGGVYFLLQNGPQVIDVTARSPMQMIGGPDEQE